MAYGHPVRIRSHRRGGRRRQLAVAPWIVLTLVAVVVASGVTVGYGYLVRSRCSGEVRATVVAAPVLAGLLDGLARRWQDTEPIVRGRCAAVEVESKDSATVAQALGAPWEAKSAGPAPDVWVPESGVWASRAATAPAAATMLPEQRPAIARSPTVIAMPKPMAQALGWPVAPLTWRDVINNFAGRPAGWGGYGKPWGPEIGRASCRERVSDTV